VPTGAAPASLIPVVAVVFICSLSDVLIKEYFSSHHGLCNVPISTSLLCLVSEVSNGEEFVHFLLILGPFLQILPQLENFS